MQLLKFTLPYVSEPSSGSTFRSPSSSRIVQHYHLPAVAATQPWRREPSPLISNSSLNCFGNLWELLGQNGRRYHRLRRRLSLNERSGVELQGASGNGTGGVNCPEESETLQSSASDVNSRDSNPTAKNHADDPIDEEDVEYLAAYMTRHNFIRVLQISRRADHPLAGSRVLLLDKPGNVHSIYNQYRLLTDSYYDVFPILPPIVPEGPIGIFGLAAGTAARLIHNFWPEIDMYGWELDPGVVDVARKYFDLKELEWSECLESDRSRAFGYVRRQDSGLGSFELWKKEKYSVFMENADVVLPSGRLRVFVGDALGEEAAVEEGFAGIIVDLYSEGAVIPALQKPETWRGMRAKLRPGGRIMVNCGGSCVDAGVGKKNGRITMEETIAAIAEEFPQELSILPIPGHGDNVIALTGFPPEPKAWSQNVPECLRKWCEGWIPCEENDPQSNAER